MTLEADSDRNRELTIEIPANDPMTTTTSFEDHSDSDLDQPLSLLRIETIGVLQLLSSVRTCISNLFRLSMVIRNVRIEDDYDRASTHYHLPTEWNIRHVRDKFPKAYRHGIWLVERLDQAITRRREYLRYRKEHHQKLSADVVIQAQQATPLPG